MILARSQHCVAPLSSDSVSAALRCVCSSVQSCVLPPSGSVSDSVKLQLSSSCTTPVFRSNVHKSQELADGETAHL